jgi:hypothetical protein
MDKPKHYPLLAEPTEFDLTYDDPIVAEVHRIRDEIFAECGYDIRVLHERVRRAQQEHPERVVSFNPKRSEPV